MKQAFRKHHLISLFYLKECPRFTTPSLQYFFGNYRKNPKCIKRRFCSIVHSSRSQYKDSQAGVESMCIEPSINGTL